MDNCKWTPIINENQTLIDDIKKVKDLLRIDIKTPETNEEKIEAIRIERNNLLMESDFIVQRHLEQKELVTLGIIDSTTLTEEKYNEWLQYRQILRDMTSGDLDLDNPIYPTKPQ
jgi:hypothetical protein